MIKISGFADEIDENCDIQFAVLQKLGIKHFEVRGVDGKNISELSEDEAKNLKKKMDSFSISASSVGSPIGKINITDDFEPHFETFRRLVKIAKILGTKYIRIFSFYRGEDDRTEVFTRLKQLIDYAKENDIILLHENEKGIYGESPERNLDLMENLGCKNFRAVFDPANYVQCGYDTKYAFDLLKDHIEYIHIKDALFKNGDVVPAGMGDGNVEYILKSLKNRGYNGFLSLEPHLGNFKGLASLELDEKMENLPDGGESTFTLAYNALDKILDKLEWK